MRRVPRVDWRDSGSGSCCKAGLSPTLVPNTTSRPNAIRIRLKWVRVQGVFSTSDAAGQCVREKNDRTCLNECGLNSLQGLEAPKEVGVYSMISTKTNE